MWSIDKISKLDRMCVIWFLHCIVNHGMGCVSLIDSAHTLGLLYMKKPIAHILIIHGERIIVVFPMSN